ncbi:MAG: cation-transporting P-type ATPase [Actinomycetota bacterium]|nr:cation-transporting P-type ATPase [Actinomycetota bacterium]
MTDEQASAAPTAAAGVANGPGPAPSRGLTAAEAADRARRGLRNVTTDDNRRTFEDIVRANVLTRFNAILGSLVLVVLLTGEYHDALFGIVLVVNALVGIVQETRAMQTLDRLAVVSAPRARVVRDGVVTEIAVENVVRDDVLDVSTGDALPVDGTVLSASGFEVDESLLTGESDPVTKRPGERVLSGSFVTAGQGRFIATDVGDAAYAAKLAKEAKQFTTVHSELRAGADAILKVATWVMVPVSILLLISQLRSSSSISEALRSSVAGVGAIVPEGLVLLTSVAFALGVIRLGRRQALIQELAAVEVLARVDIVCVDKTGTLTQGTLRVSAIDVVGGMRRDQVIRVLGALVAAEERPNPSLLAIAEVGPDPGWTVERAVPFSSARKWSGATFADRGSWLLGAPDVLLGSLDPLSGRVEALAASGVRVILLARSAEALGERPPSDLEPVALVCLEEQVRPEAAETVAYFHAQGVAVMVISGDHPETVGAVAVAVGIPGGDAPVDGRSLPEDPGELGRALAGASVFGRVQPHQKRAMVQALQRRGHVVAMTGDGVNDVLALKQADMGVAMGSGSGATRSVAQLILLDDSFASLPAVVAEGRRVIGNIERVANLFVTKSVYAALLAIAVGFTTLPFPFFPRHLTIISSLTIGIPAFFLALAPNDRRTRPGFVSRVAHFAVPAGTVAAVATFSGYAIAGQEKGVSLVQERTCAVIVLFLVALWVLVILARPLNEWKAALLGAMAVAFLMTLATPGLREAFDMEMPPVVVTLAVIGVAAIAVAVLELAWELVEWWRRRGAIVE